MSPFVCHMSLCCDFCLHASNETKEREETCESKRGNEDNAELLAEMSVHVWYKWETMNLERGLGLGRGTTSQLCCVIAAEMTLEEKPTNTWQRRGAGRTRMVIQVRRGERG